MKFIKIRRRDSCVLKSMSMPLPGFGNGRDSRRAYIANARFTCRKANSCLSFLFHLYDQWMSTVCEQKHPNDLLTIRSIQRSLQKTMCCLMCSIEHSSFGSKLLLNVCQHWQYWTMLGWSMCLLTRNMKYEPSINNETPHTTRDQFLISHVCSQPIRCGRLKQSVTIYTIRCIS